MRYNLHTQSSHFCWHPSFMPPMWKLLGNIWSSFPQIAKTCFFSFSTPQTTVLSFPENLLPPLRQISPQFHTNNSPHQHLHFSNLSFYEPIITPCNNSEPLQSPVSFKPSTELTLYLVKKSLLHRQIDTSMVHVFWELTPWNVTEYSDLVVSDLKSATTLTPL